MVSNSFGGGKECRDWTRFALSAVRRNGEKWRTSCTFPEFQIKITKQITDRINITQIRSNNQIMFIAYWTGTNSNQNEYNQRRNKTEPEPDLWRTGGFPIKVFRFKRLFSVFNRGNNRFTFVLALSYQKISKIKCRSRLCVCVLVKTNYGSE